MDVYLPRMNVGNRDRLVIELIYPFGCSMFRATCILVGPQTLFRAECELTLTVQRQMAIHIPFQLQVVQY